MRGALLTLLLLLAFAPGASGQFRLTGQASLLFENYTFDRDQVIAAGLGFDRVSELTIPVVVALAHPRYGELTISSGFVSADLSRPGTEAQNSSAYISGALDTDLRLGINVVPGRVKLLFFGSIAAGTATIEGDDAAILTVIASDVIGFAASSVGSGGAAGSGVVAALPIGRFSAGLGATVRKGFAFVPFEGSPEIDPGDELQLRAGIEGQVAPRTYLRFSGIVSTRSGGEIRMTPDSVFSVGAGTRVTAYLSLNQSVGRTALTLFAFDAYRSDPRIEETGLGTALLPRGNLLAAGAEWVIPIDARTQLVPQGEIRFSSAGCSDVLCPDGNTGLSRLGSSGRFGLEMRRWLSPAFSLVINGSGALGNVRSLEALLENRPNFADFSGFRVGIRLEGRH